MTTVLHRSTKREHLSHDFVIKNKAVKGVDDVDEATRQKTVDISRKVIKIIYDHHPVNMGQGRLGSLAQGRTIDDILSGLKNIGGLSASIFDNKEAVLAAIDEIKKSELGQSITLAGPLDDIFDICRQVGTEPHTAIVPLGIWGKTSLLPRDGVKELTMMCGHGLIGGGCVEQILDRITSGEQTVNEGTQALARLCICGAFNLTVANDILEQLVQEQKGE